MKPTRQSNGSIPVCAASPPQTPPSIFSVPLRRSWGRTAGWSMYGDAFVVMPASLPTADARDHRVTPGSDPGSASPGGPPRNAGGGGPRGPTPSPDLRDQLARRLRPATSSAAPAARASPPPTANGSASKPVQASSSAPPPDALVEALVEALGDATVDTSAPGVPAARVTSIRRYRASPDSSTPAATRWCVPDSSPEGIRTV